MKIGDFQGHRNASVSSAMIVAKKAEDFTPLSMEEYDLGYVYDQMSVQTMEEDEEINPEDAAFMLGYIAA